MEGSFIIAQIGTILTSDYLEVGTLSSGPSIVFIYLHMFEDSSPGVDPEISEKVAGTLAHLPAIWIVLIFLRTL